VPGGRKLCLVVPIAAVALLLAASGRAFAWTDPVSLSSPDARLLGAGIDSTGRATVAWLAGGGGAGHPTRIQARARRPDASLGFIKTVGTGSALPLSTLAMDGGGNSYFIWVDSDGVDNRLNYRKMSPAGTFGPAVPMSPPGGDAVDPRIAVNASGQAIVGWTLEVRNPSGPGSYRFIQVRSVAPNGLAGPIQTLDPYEQSSLRDVAIDPSGDATIIWERKAGLAAIQRTSGGTLGPVIPVDADQREAHVAVDAGGNSTLLYVHGEDLVARQLSSAGSRGPRLRVGTLERDFTRGDFTFGLDGSGTALIVWTPGFTGVPHDRILSPSGTLGPVQVLSASMGREPALGINSSGDAVITWLAQAPGNFNWQVQAVQRAADGDVGPTETISAAGPRVDDPLVALNDSGQAITAWEARRVEISAGP
jgi:hypothetical protein